jgi:hypothetical protein
MKESTSKDVTIYVPGVSSTTYRDRDQAFVQRAEEQARANGWKVTVCDNQSKGSGRYH